MKDSVHMSNGEIEQTIEILVINAPLALHRQARINPVITGVEFCKKIHQLLDLKETVSVLGGRMGLQIQYQLLFNEVPLDNSEVALASIGIQNGAQIDLKISIAQIVSNRVSEPVDYRADERDISAIPTAIMKQLLTQAFGHLLLQSSQSK